MQGSLQDMNVAELIRQNCRNFSTARITLKSPTLEGSIYIEAGQVSHAVLGELLGERAFYQMLTWSTGDFKLEHGVKSPIQSIYCRWSELLSAGIVEGPDASVGEAEAQQIVQSPPGSTPVEEHELLDRMLEIEGVLSCFAVAEDGALLAQALVGISDMESAIVVFVARAAQRSGEAFAAGELEHGVVSIGEMRLLFIPRGTSYIGLLLEQGAYNKQLVERVSTLLDVAA